MEKYAKQEICMKQTASSVYKAMCPGGELLKYVHVGFYLLGYNAVSPLKVNRRFRAAFRLNIQG
jgi:hypothetical protein